MSLVTIDQCTKIHPSLASIFEKIYAPNLLVMTNLITEPESAEYYACTFTLNDMHIKFRVAHVTPTKVGQFVTLWKRDATGGPIKPFDLADAIDFVVITVQSGNNHGQFIFSKMVLFDKGIFSKDGKGGKRAFRIYPSWNIADNAQAKKSQAWQLNYFLLTPLDGQIDMSRVKKLYQLER